MQFFSWFAFFCMWSFATPALTEFVFGAPLPMEGVEEYAAKVRRTTRRPMRSPGPMGYGWSSMVFALVLSVWTTTGASTGE